MADKGLILLIEDNERFSDGSRASAHDYTANEKTMPGASEPFYNFDDVEAINRAIEQNSSLGMKKWIITASDTTPPPSWAWVGINWSSGDANGRNKRVEKWMTTNRNDLDGTLRLSGLAELVFIEFRDNQLTELIVSDCPELNHIQVRNNLIHKLEIRNCPKLTQLYCNNNRLTRLNLSGFVLDRLDCAGNLLTRLDVSGSPDIRMINCSYNLLAELDLSGNKNLNSLDCSNNLLTELTLTAPAENYKIWAQENFLTDYPNATVTGKPIEWDTDAEDYRYAAQRSPGDIVFRVLKLYGYEVRTAATLAEIRAALVQTEPDIILLDTAADGSGGLRFYEEIRDKTQAHILFLTDKAECGLAEDGDDYIIKPVRAEPLAEKITAVMRRRAMDKNPAKILKFRHLTLDIASQCIIMNGEKIRLSQKEFTLLLYFARNEGREIGPEELYQAVWGQPMAGNDGAVKNAVSRLRKKIRPAGFEISSRRGSGYRF